jgi:hypothetical protein
MLRFRWCFDLAVAHLLSRNAKEFDDSVILFEDPSPISFVMLYKRV